MKVYIDGENFRHTLVSILISGRAIKDSRDIAFFPIRRLLHDLFHTDTMDISYYASKIKLPKGYEPSKHVIEQAEIIREFNRRWVPSLHRQNIEYVKAGYLKVKSGDSCRKCGHSHDVLHEKGVDVRMAIDIIADAFDGKYNEIVLFSSDADLAPALLRAKQKDVRIVYVCFSETINRAISSIADETITFSRRRILQLAKDGHG